MRLGAARVLQRVTTRTLARNMADDALQRFVMTEVSGICNGPETDWRHHLARQFNLLPIAADASGAILLGGDGQVFTMGWTKADVPRVAQNPQSFFPVLERLVRDHPEASELLRFLKGKHAQKIDTRP